MRVPTSFAAVKLIVLLVLAAVSSANPLTSIFRRFATNNGQASPQLSRGEPESDPFNRLGRYFAQYPLVSSKQDIFSLDGWQLLKSLTVEKMATYMRATPADLQDKCVFYTKAEEPSGPDKLSAYARTWANLHNKLSVWHLWPNKDMAEQDPRVRDFYSIDEEQSWLHKIAVLPKRSTPYPTTQYFERMSGAMAQSCRGEVYILTHRPEDLSKYSTLPEKSSKDFGNIWGNIERPILRSLYEQGLVGPLFLLDIRTWVTGHEVFPIYEYDIMTDTAKLTRKLLSKRGFTESDVLWSDGVASELQGRDYFAGWYSKDY